MSLYVWFSGYSQHMDFSQVTLSGRVVGELEMRKTNKGSSVCNFKVAVVHNKGENRTVNYVPIACFGALAENVYDTIQARDRVVLTGTVWQKESTNRDGERRNHVSMIAKDVGPSLVYANTELFAP